jgi:hypothetical protein
MNEEVGARFTLIADAFYDCGMATFQRIINRTCSCLLKFHKDNKDLTSPKAPGINQLLVLNTNKSKNVRVFLDLSFRIQCPE